MLFSIQDRIIGLDLYHRDDADLVDDFGSAQDGSPGHGHGASWSDRLGLYQLDSL